jgi:hypothetical protein
MHHLGYHSRAGLEPRTSRFSIQRINHYATRVLPRASESMNTRDHDLDLSETFAIVTPFVPGSTVFK